MAEIEVLDCGVCETVVTTVRQENLPGGRPYRHLIGIKMQLTADQRKKAEQLYLFKKTEFIKKIVGSSRSRNR